MTIGKDLEDQKLERAIEKEVEKAIAKDETEEKKEVPWQEAGEETLGYEKEMKMKKDKKEAKLLAKVISRSDHLFEKEDKVGVHVDDMNNANIFNPPPYASFDKMEQDGKEVFPGGATRNNDVSDVAWYLMPWDGLREIAKIFAEGKDSHGARNWESGQDPESTYNHLCDHLFQWWQGDRGGKENHLAKAGWGIITLLAFEARGMLDKDNTMHYKVDPK